MKQRMASVWVFHSSVMKHISFYAREVKTDIFCLYFNVMLRKANVEVRHTPLSPTKIPLVGGNVVQWSSRNFRGGLHNMWPLILRSYVTCQYSEVAFIPFKSFAQPQHLYLPHTTVSPKLEKNIFYSLQ